MQKKEIKKRIVLGVLFLLPVLFVIVFSNQFLAKHNYNPLDIVVGNVIEIDGFSADLEEKVSFKDNITVLQFLGKEPMQKSTATLNLSQMIYGKFKGFKKFQIISIAPNGLEEEVEKLKQEVGKYEDLKYWKFVYGHPQDILKLYASLGEVSGLNDNMSSDNVYIVDKELNLRGRLDDRSDKELEKKAKVYQLKSYDCISIDVLKNKMSDDMRVLFTEYRQKRKKNFDSSKRRAEDIEKK